MHYIILNHAKASDLDHAETTFAREQKHSRAGTSLRCLAIPCTVGAACTAIFGAVALVGLASSVPHQRSVALVSEQHADRESPPNPLPAAAARRQLRRTAFYYRAHN